MDTEKFNIPVPAGFKKVFGLQDLAGAGYRKDEIAKAFSGKKVNFSFEVEPRNEHDKNAIKVLAHRKGLFRTKSFHIGYIAAETVARVYEKSLEDKIYPLLYELWAGDRGGVSVRFYIVTPKKKV